MSFNPRFSVCVKAEHHILDRSRHFVRHLNSKRSLTGGMEPVWMACSRAPDSSNRRLPRLSFCIVALRMVHSGFVATQSNKNCNRCASEPELVGVHWTNLKD
eukprot:392991-Amphidinium_carterae.1